MDDKMPPMYCPFCGKELWEHGDNRTLWVRLFSCPGAPTHGDFIHVADMRWVYAPLYPLQLGNALKFESLSDTDKNAAVRLIDRISHNNVSVDKFEEFVQRTAYK